MSMSICLCKGDRSILTMNEFGLTSESEGVILNFDSTQLSPEIFDSRKMDSNFLEANFGHFRLSTARVDEKNENCPKLFFFVWPKKLLNSVLNLKELAINL